MSVLGHLQNPDSEISLFLGRHLPGVEEVTGRWRASLNQVTPVAVPVPPGRCAVLGAAFEYCVGLDLATAPPYVYLLDALPPDDAARIMRAAGFAPPHEVAEIQGTSFSTWLRCALPGHRDDAVLLAGGWYMADLEELAFKLGPDGLRALLPRVWETNPTTMRLSLQNADNLRTLWSDYRNRFRAELVALGDRVVLAPWFADGFGIGDLIAGRTLLDIKVYADPAPNLDLWLLQLLSYVLLDTDDELTLDAVGLYLPRQRRLLRRELDHLLCCLADAEVDLRELRRGFAEVARPAVEESREYRRTRTENAAKVGLACRAAT